MKGEVISPRHRLKLPQAEALRPEFPRWLQRLARSLPLLTFLAVIVGGAVNSTDSSLSDPYWPSFGGRWLPSLSEMFQSSALFLEHFHRLLIGVVGIGAVVLAVALWRRCPGRVWVRRLGVATVALVVIPAVLGGVTVLLGKSAALSIVHSAVAMLLVAATVAVAVVTGAKWTSESTRVEARSARAFLAWSGVSLANLYLQIILGALPRHATQEEGGGLLVMIGNALHIIWSFVVFAIVIMAYLEVSRGHRRLPQLFRPVLGLISLLVLQIFLGLAALMAQPDEPPTTQTLAAGDASSTHALSASSHQAAGVLMFMVAVSLTLRAGRIYRNSRLPHDAAAVAAEAGA